MRSIALAFFIPMNIDQHFKVGYILKPHGLKGEVTISLDPECPSDFIELQTVFLLIRNDLVPYFIESISISGNKGVVKFEDVSSIEEAATISKTAIFLPKSARSKSAKGEFYDDEILDYSVTDSELGLLGRVREVIKAGYNKLISVQEGKREILIPVNSPFITSINKRKKEISVSLPDGYLDI